MHASGETLGVFTHGDETLLGRLEHAVYITGSRAASPYGWQTAADLARECVETGHIVMTGGGYGIDTAAIRGALASTRSSAIVVVMPGGLHQPHPAANTDLFDAVKRAGGVLVSLWPEDTPPTRARSKIRTSWAAVHAAHTLIVEASQRSGAIHAALSARVAGRPLGAVPGPVTSATSHGTNALLATGARCVHDMTSLADFLHEPH